MQTPPTADRPAVSGLAWRTFARPQGLAGRVGGWLMSRRTGAAQREILDLLDVRPGQRILEIGFGPGVLLRVLADRTAAGHIVGVDPSPVMRRMALRRCADAVAAGRLELRAGSATSTGLPGGCFDTVVSVNNVPFWGDLSAGFTELHRVARPGATVAVAFHNPAGPSRRARRIGLPVELGTRIEATMTSVFGSAVRHDLTHLITFAATAR